MSVLDAKVIAVAKFLENKNAQEIGEFLTSVDRQLNIETEKVNQRRISLDEYKALLEEKLTVENLKWFLEITKCKHLFLLLYPDAKLTMLPEQTKWLDVPDELEGSDCTSSDGESDFGYYMDDLLRILNHINNPNRNRARLKFFNFLDLCWEAVGYDLWGAGTYDKVFDSEKNHDLKPWTVRQEFLIYIKNYLIKQTTNIVIGEVYVKILADAIKVIYLDCLHRASKIRTAMTKLKAIRGKPRIRSTSAAVIIKGLKKNEYSNQTEELAEKYKPGRHNPKVRELRKKKEADAAAAAAIEEFVTPEHTSTMNTNWLPEQSDLESFLLTTSTSTMDENDFNKGMESIFGQVSKNNKPIICVTSEHIKQLESLRATLSHEDQIMVTFWIHRLQHHLVVDSSDGKQPAPLSFLLELPVFAPGPLPSTLPDELSESFNKAMHVEFGYLGDPSVVPKRAVTAQMLRDLVNFQSSLPVNDQWMTKCWIKNLQSFAEAEDIPPSLGDSRPGALLNHFSARRNNSGTTTFDLSVKDTDPPLDSSHGLQRTNTTSSAVSDKEKAEKKKKPQPFASCSSGNSSI